MKQNMKEAIGLSLKRYNDTYMKAANDRIDNIVSQAGTDNTEIVDARIDSAGVTHTTLNNRILAETKMNDQHLVSCSGEHITAENTMGGSITNLEVLGNTIQNEEDLADIKSVGVLQEDGTYKMSILSCGKNLFYGGLESGTYQYNNGVKISSTTEIRSVRKIKVNPNSNYIISSNKPTGNIGVYYYDSKENFIKAVYDDGQKVVTTEDTHFIAFRFVNLDLDRTVQIEEGAVATPYEPYQGNKCDILLPCQLEKVGDVADRIICKDGVWGVEKNIKTDLLCGANNEDFRLNKTLAKGGYQFTWNTNMGAIANKNSEVISSTMKSYVSSNEDYSSNIWIYDGVAYVIHHPTISTADEIKLWLQTNPTIVKFPTNMPQFIPLPRNTQIQLNSFFGTTHVYMESGEVEGTIKCKIPKSLGATVQTLNNKTDILSDRIEAIEGLKDSQNMKYETDKGYLVCKETKNGVIDDLKIEGKTLVNKFFESSWGVKDVIDSKKVLKFGGYVFPSNGSIHGNCLVLMKNPREGIYTIVGKFKKTTYWNKVKARFSDGTTVLISDLNDNFELSVVTFNIKSDCTHLYIDTGDSGAFGYVEEKSLILLEGDHTQNPPSYFEGLMSVGQDVDKIEVLSCNENLFDMDNFSIGTGSLYAYCKYPNTNGLTLSIEDRDTSVNTSEMYIGVTKIGVDASQGVYWCLANQTIENRVIQTDFSYVSFFPNNRETIEALNKRFKISVYLGKINKPHIPHQSDKKQILFYNENGELEPVTELHEWDSIEKHSDNKWYYHKRSGKVVLNGSEDWSIQSGGTLTNSLLFQSSIVNAVIETNGYVHPKLLCDKFKTKNHANTYVVDEEVIANVQNLSAIRIRILKSKLSTQDVQGFKQWLQTNNVTVVYQLAQEEVYELAPLHLDSYANETLILCNSGAISPKMEFSITSHINELVKAYGERINLLEEKVYQYMVTQNRMQLASTYSADSVTFKVDYFSLCGDEENYDEDLYNLILNNILVGKDNYNYDKMFTMILDYASWNQISWEQFDILVGLMDMQHNPPVEELPTEDEIEEDIIEGTPVE